MVHQMMGLWLESASTAVAFCRSSSVAESEIMNFQQSLVRFLSLLNAMILGELEGKENGEMQLAAFYELLDAEAMDLRALEHLTDMDERPVVVFQWVQSLLVDNITAGVLCMPAPLLTRVFQDLSLGMEKYHEAMKYVEVPIPFPYTATAEVLLVIHTLMAPVLISAQAKWFVWCGVFTFVSVFTLWSLHFIATELENPFEGDANDLNMHEMQATLNRRLAVVLHRTSSNHPRLSIRPTVAAERMTKLRSFSFVVNKHDHGSLPSRVSSRMRKSEREEFLGDTGSASMENRSLYAKKDASARSSSRKQSLCEEASSPR
eukprot:CAMPEP_0194546274 /NCGR_PEP_ID=MMETSP0253-20130528/90433_1 /TAXON_ID=2966 /ORGANISM="Noctiluca scintillans" /LENGTH=317 /DNA_ID=CAMNT_0039393349 /DNA_START=218 /DNA_END=1167 /DNA_ORIENTATION=+